MSQAVVDICCFLASQHPFAVLFLFMNPFWGIPGSLLLSPSEPVKEPLASPCQEQLVTEAGQSNFTLGQCIFFLRYIYFSFWLWWVFVVARGLSLVAVGRGYLHCSVWASHCIGFSCGAQALGTWTSVGAMRGLSSCGSWALERRLSSCAAWAQLLCGMWDHPRLGMEPMFPAWAGGFFTTEPPGKPFISFGFDRNFLR